jgi:GAF domain-containing protein
VSSSIGGSTSRASTKRTDGHDDRTVLERVPQREHRTQPGRSGGAHQGAAAQLIGEGWAHARKYFSLSEKYAQWADYRAPAKGSGIHAYAHQVSRPIRLTDEELRAHDEWRNFGDEVDYHPPMRGWLAVPLIGSDGANYGFIQATDRLEGDFTEQDEANLVRLAALTSTALDALAQLHLPEYRRTVARRSSASTSGVPTN